MACRQVGTRRNTEAPAVISNRDQLAIWHPAKGEPYLGCGRRLRPDSERDPLYIVRDIDGEVGTGIPQPADVDQKLLEDG
jgi:hypothetical protein